MARPVKLSATAPWTMKPARNLVLVLLAFSVSSLAAQAIRLTKELLLADSFRYATGFGGGEFRFASDDRYTASYESEGIYWHDEGRYSIVGDRLELNAEVCKDTADGQTIPCAQSLGRATCRLQESPADLYYRTHLSCISQANRQLLFTNEENREVKAPLASRRVPAGSARVFQGHRVVTMGKVQARTTTSVKIRRGPSVTAAAVEYYAELFGGDPQNAVPSGELVTVIARSERKVAVQAWNNYWYLVNVGAMTEVWMFGEFLRFEN